ncbi:uncharacterized protein PG998_006474 [Apiospora kogelbergensis]|uniref:uncharacterized protein n=1 Tax=Apiospora kogelbergensis TaxID=1337665 RepID=UPI00312F2753
MEPSEYSKPEVKALERLPYLTSVIVEGMRLSPAIGHRIARIAPDRDLYYGDGKKRIPTGTLVEMNTILIHTDETLYPAPLSFRPDRWMTSEDRKRLDKTLAWAEMYLIIAQTVQRFDFDFIDLDDTHFQMESDQFIIGTKGNAVLKTAASLHTGPAACAGTCDRISLLGTIHRGQIDFRNTVSEVALATGRAEDTDEQVVNSSTVRAET